MHGGLSQKGLQIMALDVIKKICIFLTEASMCWAEKDGMHFILNYSAMLV